MFSLSIKISNCKVDIHRKASFLRSVPCGTAGFKHLLQVKMVFGSGEAFKALFKERGRQCRVMF